MPTFLFWNLNKKPLEHYIRNLVYLYDIDVIMLAESEIESATMLRTLNLVDDSNYHDASSSSICNKIQIFTKFPDDFISIIEEDDRYTIRHLELPGLTDILLSVVHLPDKLNWDDDDQFAYCSVFINSILEAEKTVCHSRTVLVGDFNMNPFEKGMVNALGLHSIMSRKIAERVNRIVARRKYKFFYNPMWNFYGDATRGPPGTYYYNSSKPIEYFWNIFDQVLLRPDLLDRLNDSDISVIDSDGKNSFLTKNGIPNRRIVSDHLPILFKLSL